MICCGCWNGSEEEEDDDAQSRQFDSVIITDPYPTFARIGGYHQMQVAKGIILTVL
jgi:hypothetical protein